MVGWMEWNGSAVQCSAVQCSAGCSTQCVEAAGRGVVQVVLEGSHRQADRQTDRGGGGDSATEGGRRL